VNSYDDRLVTRCVESSAVVGWLARLGAAGARAAKQSSLLSLARPIVGDAAARPGLTLIAAALTHLLVMTAVSRPPSWFWLILPLMFLAIGVVLWLMIDERPRA
jgi:hypothetical protein